MIYRFPLRHLKWPLLFCPLNHTCQFILVSCHSKRHFKNKLSSKFFSKWKKDKTNSSLKSLNSTPNLRPPKLLTLIMTRFLFLVALLASVSALTPPLLKQKPGIRLRFRLKGPYHSNEDLKKIDEIANKLGINAPVNRFYLKDHAEMMAFVEAVKKELKKDIPYSAILHGVWKLRVTCVTMSASAYYTLFFLLKSFLLLFFQLVCKNFKMLEIITILAIVRLR